MGIIKKLSIISFFAFFVLSFTGIREAKAQRGDRVSFQTFYNELDPYGRWVQEPRHGYVWIPDVGPDFQPYATGGHWIITEYGNTWVSDYSWGWAPFHYGRWEFDDYHGWFWVPGDEWGPAWVSWRSGGDYYGWAPLPPGVNINISINIPLNRWIFVPNRYITSPRLYSYCVPRTRIRNIYHNTIIINNYYERNNRRYVYGPRRTDIERATRKRVQVHQLDYSLRPGRAEVRNGSVNLYRPDISNDNRNTARPRRVENGTRSDRSPGRDESVETRYPTTSNNRREEVQRNNGNNAEVIERQRPSRTEAETQNNTERAENRRSNSGNNANSNNDRPVQAAPQRQPERERPQRREQVDQNQGERSQQREVGPRTQSTRPTEQPQKRESDSRPSRGNGRPQRG